MKRFWILISILWLATCGGGGSSPTEPKEPAPVANFTATPTNIIQGQSVTFTSTSTGTISSYSWNVDADADPEGATASFAHTYPDTGNFSVTLTVTGPGGSNSKTVADMITVTSAAPTPTTNISQTTQEDNATTITLTATDPNGQAVTFAITTDPTNGTATLSGTEITYTPNANFYGTDSFDYTASNGTYTSDPVTITITVEGEDDGNPTTNDISATTDEDTAVTLTLDATEIDGENYSFSIISQPTNGTLGSINGNQVEYTPNQDFNGTDTFTFEATDDRTFRRNVATATITVNAINDAPVANDVTASMNENKILGRYQPVTITLDATDVDGDGLTYFKQSDPSNGTLGTITNNQVVYTPTQDFNGEDTFIYKATDGNADSNGATVTITIASVNDAPVTSNQTASTNEDTAVDITLTATDVENDNLTFTIVSDVSNGTTSLSGTTVTYTPTANFNGTDTFTFKANDGELDSNISTVSVTINPVNDAPTTSAVSASTNEDTAKAITLVGADVDGDNLTYSIVSDVSNGTTSLSGSTISYTPSANFNGTDTFTYKANDGTVDSNTSTVTITVAAVNDAPVANDMSLSLDRDSSIEFTLDATDEDGNSLSKTIVSQPSNGTLLPGIGLAYKYTPSSEYFGTDTFSYKVNDGSLDSEVKEVTFTINEVTRNYEKDLNLGINGYYSIFESFQNTYIIVGVNFNSADGYFIEVDENGDVVSTTAIPNGLADKSRWYSSQLGVVKLSSNQYLFYSDEQHPQTSWAVLLDSSLGSATDLNISSSYHSIYSMQELDNGNLLLSGRYKEGSPSVNGTSFIAEIDLSGNIIFEKEYSLYTGSLENGKEAIQNIVKLSNNRGYIFQVGNQSAHQLVVKTDINGTIEWSRAGGGDSGFASSNDPSFMIDLGDKVMIGHHIAFINAIDYSGNEAWSFRLDNNTTGSFGFGELEQIIKMTDGSYIVSGEKTAVAKFDENGSVAWFKMINTAGSLGDEPQKVRFRETQDGNIFILSVHGGLQKIDSSDGSHLWP